MGNIHKTARQINTEVNSALKDIIETKIVDRAHIRRIFADHEWVVHNNLNSDDISDGEWLGCLQSVHEDVQIWESSWMEEGIAAYKRRDLVKMKLKGLDDDD